MGESSGSNNMIALANEIKHGDSSCSPPVFLGPSESSVERMEGVKRVHSIEEIIEKSKSHWSIVAEFDSDNEVAEESNVEVFRTLQMHPTWGTFFKSFGEGEGGDGELVMGQKFAEGMQAELYKVQIEWNDRIMREDVLKLSLEFVLKVFKKGTFLRHLKTQWPQGMLQHYAETMKRSKFEVNQIIRFHSDIVGGTLLEDGRFAFVMVKEREDLRSMIDHIMLTRPKDKGPFFRRDAELAMYLVACGMDQLHNRGIVHRDIKASNVLVARKGGYYIADFECSIGIVGTGFFRAPEILEARKYGNVGKKAELFTREVDVYSYGMTCYEILTGKLPFEGHEWIDSDLVVKGERPEIPKYIRNWTRELLNRCWQSNPVARPSSGEILKIILANSAACRELESKFKRRIERNRNALERNSKVTESPKSLKLRIPKLKMFCFAGNDTSH